MGFLPEAMRNYLLRLGWSHGDDEIIPTTQAIEWFGLENIGKGPARFDFDKLDSLNVHYMRQLSPKELLSAVENDLEKKTGNVLSGTERIRIESAMSSIVDRAKRLPDVVDGALLFCNIRPVLLTEKAAATLGGQQAMLESAANELTAITNWKQDVIKAAIMSFAQARDLKMGKVMQPIRAALTGGAPSGDLIELLEILGQEETLARLKDQATA